MDVESPNARSDVLAGLEVLASPTPTLVRDQDPRWPGLTEAVHWVVDDTWWDQRDPAGDVGRILRNDQEATLLREVVAAILSVSNRQGAVGDDAAWFTDEQWWWVQSLAAAAVSLLRGDADSERPSGGL